MGGLSREECEDAVCILIACTFKILHYTPLACLRNCAIEITNLARLSAHSNGRILHRWRRALIVLSTCRYSFLRKQMAI